MILIDLAYLQHILLPISLRKTIVFSFLQTIRLSLEITRQAFYDFYDKKAYELKFNGQVIYLEHLLNDKYDNTLRRIYIDDENEFIRTFIYNKFENNEKTYLFNNSENVSEVQRTYLYNKSEIAQLSEFTIYIPSNVVFVEAQLNRLVNTYKLAGKKYKIVIV